MDPAVLSERYQVRRLTEADVEAIYRLCAENPLFYQHCPPFVTRESIRADSRALPPGKTAADKYYLGYFQGDQLAAVLDLILDYPRVIRCLDAGADVATCPLAAIKGLLKHPLTDSGLAQFLADHARVNG